MDASSNVSVSSFYEPPETYSEEETKALYQQMKKNFEEVNDLFTSLRKDLSKIKKDAAITVKLIEMIESVTTEESDKEPN